MRWVGWLYEAKKRYGLCVLNYIVTSNHIHLLVLDTAKNVISNSMQLIAGIDQLLELLNIDHYQSFQQLHRQWVEEELQRDQLQRDPSWSESIAVGSEAFVKKTKELLRSRAHSRKCQPIGDRYHLKEPEIVYQVHLGPEKLQLRLDNSYFWEDNVGNTKDSLVRPDSSVSMSHNTRPVMQ